MQHHIYWIRIFCRKVHFHWISFVNEINLSLWQISYLVTCHLITTVWLSSHQFPSPTHRCWVFLLYILSLWKLITDIQCTAEKVYFELCCKGKMAHKLLFISKAKIQSIYDNECHCQAPLQALCFQVVWKSMYTAFQSKGRQSNGRLHESTRVHNTNLTDVKFCFQSNRRLAFLNGYSYTVNAESAKIILRNCSYCNLQTRLSKLVNDLLQR